MSAKNLGQIAGLQIGSTPPNNTTLIWFDNTPSVNRHKVYDFSTNQWIVLDKSIITSITYSELTNKAQGTGLSVGEYFMITDKANILALAITRTKVQYTDIQGNILIDDLGTNIVYHVTSSNLFLDDINGVYDEETATLVFRFSEEEMPEKDDYILSKGQRQSGGSSVWQFLKFKISNLISKKTGNSLKWDGGLFLDVMGQIKDSEDTPTGVVSMQTFTEKVNALETSINNVGKENQSIINKANQNLNAATTPAQIYSKKLPTAPTAATATDIVKGDTLTTIVNKIQRWITQFKIATGIKVSKDFAANGDDFNINNNDTVDSALRKVQGNMKNFRDKLEEFETDWKEKIDDANSRQGDKILVSSGTGTTAITPITVTEKSHNITFGESLKSALQKFFYMCTQIQGWQIVDYSIPYRSIKANGIIPTGMCILRINEGNSVNLETSQAILGFIISKGAIPLNKTGDSFNLLNSEYEILAYYPSQRLVKRNMNSSPVYDYQLIAPLLDSGYRKKQGESGGATYAYFVTILMSEATSHIYRGNLNIKYSDSHYSYNNTLSLTINTNSGVADWSGSFTLAIRDSDVDQKAAILDMTLTLMNQ